MIFLVIDIGLISLVDSCDFMVFFYEKRFSVVFTPLLKDDIQNWELLAWGTIFDFLCLPKTWRYVNNLTGITHFEFLETDKMQTDKYSWIG